MNSRVIVVLMVDGLRARSLGAYGNTWHATPAIDQFASQGIVFDRMVAESTDLMQLYDSYWSPVANSSGRVTPLVEQLREDGFYTHLLTDESSLTQRSDCELFDEATLINSTSQTSADDVMECGVAVTLAEAADRLGEWSAEYEQPRLMWVHLRGLTAAWDAPVELSESLLGEEDPPLEATTLVPEQQTSDLENPDDAILHAACRYAGQIMALDAAIGAFASLVDELFAEVPVELVLSGTRGFALGEHGWLGTNAPLAHRELFHVPLVVRGSNVPALRREPALAQSCDFSRILYTLASNGSLPSFDRKLARGTSERSRFIENDQWSFVSLPDDAMQSGELFVMPDDQWQSNNVASICPEEVAQLEGMLDA